MNKMFRVVRTIIFSLPKGIHINMMPFIVNDINSVPHIYRQ